MATTVRGKDSRAAGGAPELENDPSSARVSEILAGAIDLHCHSGPSVMPRNIDHIEALHDAAANGLRAVLIKDHYYSATPITELLNAHFKHLPVRLYSGVPLNNTAGGLNPYAVDHGVKLGARLVWMPTFSARNHIEHERRQRSFPPTSVPMREPTPLTVLDPSGRVTDEAKLILDIVAEHDVVLSGGHLHISEIVALFDEAKRRGARRLLVNHPSYLVDASLEDMRQLARMGAYLEHSICMFVPESKFRQYTPERLKELIEAVSVDNTILGSDLGQVGNCWPARGFRNVICVCLALGYSDASIKKMIAGNPAKLLGLDPT